MNSKAVNLEQTNPIVDGIKITAKDVTLDLDTENTKWSSSSTCTWEPIVIPFNGADQFMYPGAYEVRFFDEIVDSSSTSIHPSFGNSRINFDFKQQIYGPLVFGFGTTLNLEDGNYYNKKYSLNFKRRAYSIGAFYNTDNNSAGINFKIYNFDYRGLSPKF